METENLEDLRDTAVIGNLGDFCEKLLQAVCLEYSLLEDQASDTTRGRCTESGVEQALPNNMTLRAMRRTGQLGELGREAQSTLLGGALYQYSNSAAPLPPADTRQAAVLSATATRGFSGDAAPGDMGSFARSRAPFASTNADILELRNSIQRILRLPDANEGEHQDRRQLQSRTNTLLEGELAGDLDVDVPLGDETVDEATILAANLEEIGEDLNDEVSPVQVPDQSRLSDEPSARFSSAGAADGALPSFVRFEDEVNDSNHLLGSTVIDELGDTTFSLEQLERTLLGETVSPEGGLDGGLIGVLRRIAAGASLNESLLRTVHRVLQLGTLLSGHRLSDEDIQNLPKVRFEQAEEQNCAICLEAYETGELLTALPCSHFFHVDCLARWLQRASQCPLCRATAADTRE